MKELFKILMVFLAFLLVFSCTKPTNQNDPKALMNELIPGGPVNSLSAGEAGLGWKLLFNGTDFSGWHGFNMDSIPSCWIIEDGTMTMTTEGRGESQDVVTDKEYKSFALSLEYKMDTAANSGVIFQIREDTVYKYPYETGPEYQIIDEANWPGKLEDWQTAGANYAMYPPKVKPVKPVGEWNHAFIVVNGNHVWHFLNGELTAEYEKYSDEWKKLRESGKWANYPDYGKYDEGRISLQNHGTRVWFRNIKIKELQ